MVLSIFLHAKFPDERNQTLQYQLKPAANQYFDSPDFSLLFLGAVLIMYP